MGHLCVQRTTRLPLFKNTLTHFPVFVLEAAPGSRSLWSEIHHIKPWAGTKIPIPVESPPERDWALLGAENSVGCLERVTLLQAGPTFTASPQPSPQGKNTAKLVSAFRPVPVLSLEPTWFLPSWEIRKECLSRCH